MEKKNGYLWIDMNKLAHTKFLMMVVLVTMMMMMMLLA